MTTHRLLAVVVLAALTGLTACGSADGPSARPGSPSTTESPTSTPVEDLTLPSSGSSAVIEVRGAITEGVEAGCLVFTPESATTDGSWVLVGNTAGLDAGQTVTLRGTPAPEVVTTCQQGTPFRVESVIGR
ncbi:hypothetical protein [Knoellia sp. p5-6-4]|uniref:hypothetical protein n=1 Tax=unclassified Knoellia TaxID=2618719 RepID=UPI0023DC0294|nr:hypothetical protein [Knoellia sp. p5-6-4]MDF2144940.1 hypothetical protein [Knoellia sp. p5-6-4]